LGANVTWSIKFNAPALEWESPGWVIHP
jgi:hypothetical protein